MKKHFVSLVAFVSLLALASCAETSSTTPTSSNSTVENSTTSAEENSTTTSTTTDSTTTSTTVTTDTSTTSDSTVTDVEVTEVKLNKTSLTLEIGKSETLTATVLPENATDKSVTWTSDNEKIATVDANGKVTAVAAGETLITATAANGVKATCTLTVEKATVELTSITISGATEVLVGEKITLTATPNAGATLEEVTWKSSDTTIATVENGVVTGVKAGTVEITASSGDITSAPYTIEVKDAVVPPTIVEQGKFGLYQVTLGEARYFTGEMDGYYFGTTTDYAAAVDVIAYEAEGGVTLRIGEEGQYIGARLNDGHNNILMQDDPYVWEYDAENDAYITNLGEEDLFIGNSQSYDTLSLNDIKYINKEGNNIAHIVQEEIQAPALETIEISGSKSVAIGSQITLKATPNLGAELVDVVWTSSDTDVATVENGVVTGLTEGTTEITAKSGEITSDPFEVTVVAEIPSADTLGGTIDFTGITGNMSGAGSIGEALVFEPQNESGLTFVSSSGETNMYAATNQNTQDGIPGIKFGTGKNDGSVTLTFSGAEIGKVVLTGVHTWSGKTVSVTVNDVTQDATFSATGSLEFVLASPTTEITLTGSGSERRFILGGMELYTI